MADKAPLQSEDEEVNTSEDQAEITGESEEERMIPKSRLDKVIEQRDEFKTRFEETNEKLSSLEETIKELRDSVTAKQDKTEGVAFTSEEEQALARIEKGLKAKEFLTKADLEELRRIDRRNNEMNRLSEKYGKSSGYPTFKADDVLVYAKKNGFGDNLEAAFRDMHWDAFVQIAAKKASGAEPPDSEKPTGGDREVQTQVTRNKIAEMDVNEWSQNRDSIMDKFKKSIFGK